MAVARLGTESIGGDGFEVRETETEVGLAPGRRREVKQNLDNQRVRRPRDRNFVTSSADGVVSDRRKDPPRRIRDNGSRSLRSQSIQCLTQRHIEIPSRSGSWGLSANQTSRRTRSTEPKRSERFVEYSRHPLRE